MLLKNIKVILGEAKDLTCSESRILWSVDTDPDSSVASRLQNDKSSRRAP